MANLNYREITREGKEYRTELLVDKVFLFNGKENKFVTDDGLFKAEYIVVNDEKVIPPRSKPRKTQVDGAVDKILSLSALPSKDRKILLGGKFVGQRKVEEISLSDLQKSEEFGGQIGKKINKGILFENNLMVDLNTCISGKKCKGDYAKQAETIITECSKYVKSPVTSVELMGGLNQSRPIAVQGKQLYILPTTPSKHGEKLTDITLHHKNGKSSFLSLKYSSTLTFMNAGVGKFLSEKQIKNGKITDPVGKAILKTFSLNEAMFCRVFNEYKKTKFKSVKAKINASALQTFMSTAIGSNYWMVHGMDGGKVYFWNISKEKNKTYSKVTGDIEIQYGGSAGNGKRIDILFSNQYYDFKVNIRNKQSGLYPSHIMCDYKSKPATGKKLI